MPPIQYDRDVLHRLLFRRADRLGRLKINLRALADETGIDYFWLSRIISEMVEAGRMKRLARAQNAQWTFLIEDPEVYHRKTAS